MKTGFVIRGNICQTKTPQALDIHERAYAVCIDGEAALRLIREAACEGVRRANEIRPWTLTYPAEIRFHFNYTWFCDQMAAALPHWTRIDGRTMARQIDKIVTYRDVNLS